MDEEFYHLDIFGTVIDFDRGAEEAEADLVGKKSLPDFNIFAFTDALASRHKKECWVLFERGRLAGVSAEELFFKAAWIVRSMLLASRTASFKETEMKEFPYNKAKRALANWQPGELENLSERLVVGYHEARRGNAEIETVLERIILRL